MEMKPFAMPKEKHKYDVFWVGHGNGVYAEDYCREYVGSTWAISEEQACNNVRYQNRTKEFPHGGYSTDSMILGDILDEGFVVFRYEAIQVD